MYSGCVLSSILVPLDGSRLAEEALPYAEALAKCKGGTLTLLRVVGHPATHVYVQGYAVQAMQSDDSAEHCEAYLRRIADMLSNKGINVTVILKTGPVADAILDYADEMRADTIVMSTRGRTGAGRWLMGSVADRVKQVSKMPVLLIRPSAAAAGSRDSVHNVETGVAPSIARQEGLS